MDDNFKELVREFKVINKKKYIKGINNNILNSCGLTFEYLLGKDIDDSFLPDYRDIEIKCTQRYSRYAISLFSLSFEGPSLFESNYLLETYGSYDKDFPDKKNLFLTLKCNEKTLVNEKFYFELIVDDNEKMLFINIYDINNNFIEKRAYIAFENLKSRLQVKLSKLAVIYASKKKIDDDLYFRYYKIVCYILKDFDNFIRLLKNNIIKVNLIFMFAKSGKYVGKNSNKNMVFKIYKKDLDCLFEKIYEFEN